MASASRNRSRIAVYLKTQSVDSSADPAHFASKILSVLLLTAYLDYGYHKPPVEKVLNGTALQLKTDETWQQVKQRFRASEKTVPKLLPPRRPENLLIYYPIPAQESFDVTRNCKFASA